jgi:NTE family protein
MMSGTKSSLANDVTGVPENKHLTAPKKRLVIAFGSGGGRALASLGVMSVLRKHNIFPAAVSGTSMGAIIAAYYAVHGETETLRQWYEKRKSYEYFTYLASPNFSTSFIGTEKLQKLLDGFVQGKRFDETIVPLRIPATNLRTGEQRIFNKGRIIHAMMASSAIPGFMPPFAHDTEQYVDGGLVNPTPIDLFPAKRYDHFLAIDFHMHVPAKLPKLGTIDTMSRAIQIATHTAFERHLKGYRRRTTIVLPVDRMSMEMLRFDKSKEYIALGERAGERLIGEWKRSGLYDDLRAPPRFKPPHKRSISS